VLVVADHDNSKLFDSTMAALTAAQQIGGSVTMLVAGSNCSTAAKQAAGLKGVGKVLCADNAAYAHGGAENLAALVHKHAAEFTHVVTSASSTGKGFIPRAAVLNDSAPITDVVRF
jgi:electron transfer flavoprotein alpha subunit